MKNSKTIFGRFFLTAIAALLLAGLLAGCTPGTTTKTGGDVLKIIASITPVADFVKQIGGDKVEVTIMSLPVPVLTHTNRLPARWFLSAKPMSLLKSVPVWITKKSG